MPFEQSPVGFSYIKLFVVVLLGVTGGNLLSNWVSARVVAYQLETAASKAGAHLRQEAAQAQQAMVAARARNQRETAAHAAQVQQTRRADKIGIKLGQACAEWTKANLELQSYTTRTEQEKACTRLNAYVQSGIAPRQ